MIEDSEATVERPGAAPGAQDAVELAASTVAGRAAAAGLAASPAVAVAVHYCAVQSDANNEARNQVEQALPVPAGKEAGAVSQEVPDALASRFLPCPPFQIEDSLDARLQDIRCPQASQFRCQPISPRLACGWYGPPGSPAAVLPLLPSRAEYFPYR